MNFAPRSNVAVVLEAVFVVILAITGLLSNLAVCVVIFKNTAVRRRATNIAVVGLAASDISLFVFPAPFLLTTIVEGRWIFGKRLYDFDGLTIYALSTISLYLMALIAVNRFFCVVRSSRFATS